MKRITLFAVAAGSIVSCIFGATGVDAERGGTRSTSNRVSDKDALIEVEHAWGNALLKKDVAGFSRCLAVEWVLITSDGNRVTKAVALADLKSGALKIESFRLEDVTVRLYGDTAVVRGLITEKSKLRDKDTSGKSRFTDVFVKRDGRWQAVASHESNIRGG
jgi:ketosteroid isomerase-like protein